MVGQNPLHKRALAGAEQTNGSAKETSINRLNRELKLFKEGTKAALKFARGKSLSAEEKQNFNALSKRAGGIITLILAAIAGTALSIKSFQMFTSHRPSKTASCKQTVSQEQFYKVTSTISDRLKLWDETTWTAYKQGELSGLRFDRGGVRYEAKTGEETKATEAFTISNLPDKEAVNTVSKLITDLQNEGFIPKEMDVKIEQILSPHYAVKLEISAYY